MVWFCFRKNVMRAAHVYWPYITHQANLGERCRNVSWVMCILFSLVWFPQECHEAAHVYWPYITHQVNLGERCRNVSWVMCILCSLQNSQMIGLWGR